MVKCPKTNFPNDHVGNFLFGMLAMLSQHSAFQISLDARLYKNLSFFSKTRLGHFKGKQLTNFSEIRDKFLSLQTVAQNLNNK